MLERTETAWSVVDAWWAATPTSITRYLYDGWDCVAEFSVSGGTVTHQRSYVWGLDLSGSRTGAGGVGGLVTIYQAPMSSPTAHFTAYDGNGNVVALVKASDGTLSARYEYGPFGEPLRATGDAIAAANPWRFSTKRTDPTTALVHYEYRVYQPITGRWLGRDPVEERGGANLRGFVGNRSVNEVDLLGLFWPFPDYDPDKFEHHDPLPLPDLNSNESQDGIDEELEARTGRLGSIKKMCREISATSKFALSFTPQDQFSQVALGETLGQEPVGNGSRALAAATVYLPGGEKVIRRVGKTITACCRKGYICIFYVETHHLIPKTRFKNHPLIRAADIDIVKDVDNLMDLLHHRGGHTRDYNNTVDQLLTEAYNEFRQGRMSAKEAYAGVCKTLREGITDGSIRPYNSKDVFPAP